MPLLVSVLWIHKSMHIMRILCELETTLAVVVV